MDMGLTFPGIEHVKWRYFLTVSEVRESISYSSSMSFPFPLRK